jgi:hypothetical protein
MKPTVFAAIAASSMLLFVGCSSPGSQAGQADKTAPKDTTTLSETTKQDAAKDMGTTSAENNKSATEMASAPSTDTSTVDVQLDSSQMFLNSETVDAGSVSLDIQNNSKEPLEVYLLKTDLPAGQIPTKAGKIDLASDAVKQVGELVTNPMPANGQETLTRTLEPGKYVLMAYTPGHIESAISQAITVKAPGI